VKEELYMAGMEIMKAGDFGTSLYIIREGGEQGVQAITDLAFVTLKK